MSSADSYVQAFVLRDFILILRSPRSCHRRRCNNDISFMLMFVPYGNGINVIGLRLVLALLTWLIMALVRLGSFHNARWSDLKLRLRSAECSFDQRTARNLSLENLISARECSAWGCSRYVINWTASWMRYPGIDLCGTWTGITRPTMREGCHPFRFGAKVPHRCTCFWSMVEGTTLAVCRSWSEAKIFSYTVKA